MTTAILLHLDFVTAATITGIFATTGCALPAMSDFCLPSFVMNLFGKDASCSLPEVTVDDSPVGEWWIMERPVHAPSTRTLYVSGTRRGC